MKTRALAILAVVLALAGVDASAATLTLNSDGDFDVPDAEDIGQITDRNIGAFDEPTRFTVPSLKKYTDPNGQPVSTFLSGDGILQDQDEDRTPLNLFDADPEVGFRTFFEDIGRSD